VSAVVRALRDNVTARLDGNGGIQGGGSTITQQVAKNFLLSFEQTWERKIQEAILALRIESTFSKDKILELYLNEIFLGSVGGQLYGVAAAALNYFDKALYELTLSESAYLAALPKGAENYNPFRRPKAAIERRNWVLDRMLENNYITPEEAEQAKAEPLNVVPRQTGSAALFSGVLHRRGAPPAQESLRRGPALWRRAKRADDAGPQAAGICPQSADGRAHRLRPERGVPRPGRERRPRHDWGVAVHAISPLSDVPEWTLAVVLEMGSNEATIGLRPASELQQVPEMEGALVAMDPRTGRVLAMVGGFSFAESSSTAPRRRCASRAPRSSRSSIRRRARQRLHAVLGGARRAARDRSGPRPRSGGRRTMPGKFYGPRRCARGIERRATS
jgi:penicillin-binding protein 1A